MTTKQKDEQLYLFIVKKLTSSEGFCRKDLREFFLKQGRKEEPVPANVLGKLKKILGEEDLIEMVGKLKSRFIKYYIKKYDTFTCLKKVQDYFNNCPATTTTVATTTEKTAAVIMPSDIGGYDINRYAKTFNVSVSDLNPRTAEWFKDKTIPGSIGIKNTIYLLEVMKPYISKGNNEIPIMTLEDNLKKLIGKKQKFNLWYYLYVIYVIGECPKVDFITGTVRGSVLVKNLELPKLEALQRRLFNKMPSKSVGSKRYILEVEEKIFKNSNNKLNTVEEVYIPEVPSKKEKTIDQEIILINKRDVSKIVYALYALLKNDGQTSHVIVQTLLKERYGLDLDITLIKSVMMYFSVKYGYFSISDDMVAKKKNTALLDEMAMQHKYSDVHDITLLTLKNEEMVKQDINLPVEKIGSAGNINILSFKIDIENPEQRNLLFLLWLKTEPRLGERVILPESVRENFEERLKKFSSSTSKFSAEIEEDLRLCETL